MTFHKTRDKRKARGTTSNGKRERQRSPRIVVSIDADDFRRLAWWANRKGVPTAAVIRDAVRAYLLPVRVDADRAAGLNVDHIPPAL